MKKGLLTSAALVMALASLTGCSSSKTKTLTCTQKSDGDLEMENKWVYKFKDNRVSSATKTSTITAGGDKSQYIEDYKKNFEQVVDSYKSVSGVSAKVSQKSNKVILTIKYDTSKMEEADIDVYNLNESTESLPTVLDEGYTCK